MSTLSLHDMTWPPLAASSTTTLPHERQLYHHAAIRAPALPPRCHMSASSTTTLPYVLQLYHHFAIRAPALSTRCLMGASSTTNSSTTTLSYRFRLYYYATTIIQFLIISHNTVNSSVEDLVV